VVSHFLAEFPTVGFQYARPVDVQAGLPVVPPADFPAALPVDCRVG
jgi:hypothetical protein